VTPRGAIRIGTRGSQLALWQATTVARLLETAGVPTLLVPIRTSGDRLQEAPLPEAGGKRLFVKEIEDALLRGEVDAAVHSAKDMPYDLPDGLAIAAALPREDPRDAMVLPNGAPSGTMDAVMRHLGASATLRTIGTSSVRRTAQLAAVFPAARFAPVRGNVDTRLRKLDAGEYAALVLASAGLRRLGHESRISAAIPVELCTPAPGQGIVAVEIRADDEETKRRLAGIHDRTAGLALRAERALVEALGGGCQLPLGGLAVLEDASLAMRAVVAAPDGSHAVRASVRGLADDPEGAGRQAAAALEAAGASAILDAVRRYTS
jgi:hydroxymethylbilane synthase